VKNGDYDNIIKLLDHSNIATVLKVKKVEAGEDIWLKRV
jgi:hypothetical protein